MLILFSAKLKHPAIEIKYNAIFHSTLFNLTKQRKQDKTASFINLLSLTD